MGLIANYLKGVDALKGLGIGYWILYMVFAMMSP